MIYKTYKYPKIAICRRCKGRGTVVNADGHEMVCTQCDGSGRVTVSGSIVMDIRPYHAKDE